MAISPDYYKEIEKKPAQQKPAKKYDPAFCVGAKCVRVTAGDFSAPYEYDFPPHIFKDAIRRVQRGNKTPPYCAFQGRLADLAWIRRDNGRFEAYFVCRKCRKGVGCLDDYLWIVPPEE